MKCIAAVVMMAFVAVSQAYVTRPLVYSGLPLAYRTVGTPGVTQYASLPETTLVAHAAPTVVRTVPTVYSAPTTVVRSVPLTYAAPTLVRAAPLAYTQVVAPAPVAYTAVQDEAKYTAVTRGAVHEAPLPGHTLSQTSLNLAPAA